MTTYPALKQAQKHPGAILVHRVSDSEWQAYVAGDTLPQESASDVPQEVTMRQARLALLPPRLRNRIAAAQPSP